MITVYSAKPFPTKGKVKYQFVSTDDISTRIKLSVKAQKQPRRKDGRFSKPIPKPSAVEKNPLVSFAYYNNDFSYGKLHYVRLISADDNYYTGLDLIDMNAKKWQYKKFLVKRAKGFRIMEFNSKAMS